MSQFARPVFVPSASRSRLAKAALILLLLAWALPAAAQVTVTEEAPAPQVATPEAAATDVLNTVNYCGSALTYTLPDGWIATRLITTRYGAIIRLANGTEALIRSGDQLASGDAVIIVNIVPRPAITRILGLNADAAITSILEQFGVQAPVTNFTPDLITPISVNDAPAARFDVNTGALATTLIAVELDDASSDVGAVALVSLSAPAGEVAPYERLILDFAESLAFDAPATTLAINGECLIASVTPEASVEATVEVTAEPS